MFQISSEPGVHDISMDLSHVQGISRSEYGFQKVCKAIYFLLLEVCNADSVCENCWIGSNKWKDSMATCSDMDLLQTRYLTSS